MASRANLSDDVIAAISDCIDRDAIRQKLSLYARAVDRCDADLLRTIFWFDAVDDHGGFRGNVDALIEHSFPLLRQLDQSHHHLANPAISIQGDIAEVETYFIAYHRVRPGTGEDFMVGGRYIDTFERRNQEWRILLRRVAYDYNCSGDGVEWTNFAFASPHSIGGRKPDDPFYRPTPN